MPVAICFVADLLLLIFNSASAIDEGSIHLVHILFPTSLAWSLSMLATMAKPFLTRCVISPSSTF
jgi:hypothetical protein